jgi:hypothetical protein
MTNGQIAQLQELNRCYFADNEMGWFARVWVPYILEGYGAGLTLMFSKVDKAILRNLWHQYRNQIAAMRKNRGKA